MKLHLVILLAISMVGTMSAMESGTGDTGTSSNPPSSPTPPSRTECKWKVKFIMTTEKCTNWVDKIYELRLADLPLISSLYQNYRIPVRLATLIVGGYVLIKTDLPKKVVNSIVKATNKVLGNPDKPNKKRDCAKEA